MSFYVMSDIHGCYDDFMKMLWGKIQFNHDDVLVLLGDYIDRGKQNYDMLGWLEYSRPEHCVVLRGNHEEEFIANINILSSIKDDLPLLTICEKLHEAFKYFDTYGTIRDLIKNHGATLEKLQEWAIMFNKMPLQFRRKVDGKRFLMAHAGFIMPDDAKKHSVDRKEFCLYAREESYKIGGMANHIVISGHTPTIIKGEFSFTGGKVFRYYNEEKDCTYYNIDCGCAFRNLDKSAKLACIRLEDEEIFYI